MTAQFRQTSLARFSLRLRCDTLSVVAAPKNRSQPNPAHEAYLHHVGRTNLTHLRLGGAEAPERHYVGLRPQRHPRPWRPR